MNGLGMAAGTASSAVLVAELATPYTAAPEAPPAHIIRRQGQEIHAAMLAAAIAGKKVPVAMGSSGEVLDSEAFVSINPRIETPVNAHPKPAINVRVNPGVQIGRHW